MDERSCIELAAALGVTSHGGWRDLVDRVRAMSSVPGGVGRAYDDVRHALGALGGGGAIPWHELVAEVKDARERSDSVKHVTGELAEAMGMTDMGRWSDLLDTVRRWRADREPSPAQPADSNGESDSGGVESEPVISAIESLTAAMITDPREWESNRMDAWIYGIIVGWQPTALDEVASLHGWSDEIKRRLRDLHAAVSAASGYAP